MRLEATDELTHTASRNQRPRGRRRPVALLFWCRSTGWLVDQLIWETRSRISYRLLKKVQMQGGSPGTHPQDGCGREAYCIRTSQRRASEPGTQPEAGCRRWAFFRSLLEPDGHAPPRQVPFDLRDGDLSVMEHGRRQRGIRPAGGESLVQVRERPGAS